MSLDNIEFERKAVAKRLRRMSVFTLNHLHRQIPYNLDFDKVPCRPSFMEQIPNLILDCIRKNTDMLKATHICGVPYNGFLISPIVAVKLRKSMLIRRLEPIDDSDNHPQKFVEGVFSAGETCLVIGDADEDGHQLIKTIQVLRNEGIVVTDAIVIVDHELGATENLAKYSVRLHSVYTILGLVGLLLEMRVFKSYRYINKIRIYNKNYRDIMNVEPLCNILAKMAIKTELTTDSKNSNESVDGNVKSIEGSDAISKLESNTDVDEAIDSAESNESVNEMVKSIEGSYEILKLESNTDTDSIESIEMVKSIEGSDVSSKLESDTDVDVATDDADPKDPVDESDDISKLENKKDEDAATDSIDLDESYKSDASLEGWEIL